VVEGCARVADRGGGGGHAPAPAGCRPLARVSYGPARRRAETSECQPPLHGPAYSTTRSLVVLSKAPLSYVHVRG
jgi:hypothetical protein